MTDKLAIDGGSRTRNEPFPPWPHFEWDDGAAVSETLRSGRLTQITGSYVRDFEHAFTNGTASPTASLPAPAPRRSTPPLSRLTPSATR